jgi:hypothetical protein
MGNKALKELRRTLEDMPCGGDLVELLDKAIEHEAGRPERQMAKSQARQAKAKADLLELQLAERRGELVKVSDVEKQVELHFDGLRFAFVGDAVEYKHYFAEPGIVASILADQRAKRDERREREANVQKEELRIEELRGFYRGCNQALRIVLAEHDDHLGSVTRSALSCVANAIRHARKEG